MWSAVAEAFEDLPAQRRVASLMLERGYRVEDGRICSGSIRLPSTGLAEEVGVDRRVVDATAETIEDDEELSEVFSELRSVAFLGGVAPAMGMGVIEIEAEDPSRSGLLGEVATCVAEHGLSIHQAVADDPELSGEPLLTVVTEERPPGELVEELSGLENVAKVAIY